MFHKINSYSSLNVYSIKMSSYSAFGGRKESQKVNKRDVSTVATVVICVKAPVYTVDSNGC